MQSLIQANYYQISRVMYYWPFCDEKPLQTGKIPARRVTNRDACLCHDVTINIAFLLVSMIHTAVANLHSY